jgi:hypothetical protein
MYLVELWGWEWAEVYLEFSYTASVVVLRHRYLFTFVCWQLFLAHLFYFPISVEPIGSRLTFTKGIYVQVRVAKLSLLFKIFSQYTNIIFLRPESVTDDSSIASTGHGFWVHQQFEICYPPVASSLGLSQGCKEGGSWFPSSLLPVSPGRMLIFLTRRTDTFMKN